MPNTEKKQSSKKEQGKLKLYSTISSNLITYIIVMTVLAMVFAFVTYGFTMYQITESKFTSDEAIFVFLFDIFKLCRQIVKTVYHIHELFGTLILDMLHIVYIKVINGISEKF